MELHRKKLWESEPKEILKILKQISETVYKIYDFL